MPTDPEGSTTFSPKCCGGYHSHSISLEEMYSNAVGGPMPTLVTPHFRETASTARRLVRKRDSGVSMTDDPIYVTDDEGRRCIDQWRCDYWDYCLYEESGLPHCALYRLVPVERQDDE